MESKVQKWGNSNGIRIPKNYLDSLGLKTDDLVDIVLKDNKIIITKKITHKISLKERIASYKGPNLCKDFEWDEHRGKEIW